MVLWCGEEEQRYVYSTTITVKFSNNIKFTHSKVVECVLPHWSTGWRSTCDPRQGNLVRADGHLVAFSSAETLTQRTAAIQIYERPECAAAGTA